MNKFLIRIDRKTVRKNPDFGATEACIAGPVSTTFTFRQSTSTMPRCFRECDVMESAVIVTNRNKSFRYVLWQHGPPKLGQMRAIRMAMDGEVKVDRPMQTFRIGYQPEFLFKYRPTRVECKVCHAKFLHTKLLDRESDDGDAYSGSVCPKCGAWDCCHLEFEKI